MRNFARCVRVACPPTSRQSTFASGHQAIVKFLLEKGVDVNAPSDHFSNALHTAIHFNDGEAMVKVLLKNGAIVNADVLHAANFWGNRAIVKMLIESGANVNA